MHGLIIRMPDLQFISISKLVCKNSPHCFLHECFAAYSLIAMWIQELTLNLKPPIPFSLRRGLCEARGHHCQGLCDRGKSVQGFG